MFFAPRRGDPDRYQILAEHGRGGLGRVYRARDKELGRHVALKELLQPSYTAEVRFFREAFITARLEHPAIVPVHEAGRWPDGTPYYAMKLVSGRPLAELIAEAKELDGRLALIPHLIAVADAIAYAHDRKIIHRDLKPSNVIVGDFGETIVIDWGLAKELAVAEDEVAADPYRVPGASTVTVAGSILGTPAYMSPEQARGEAVDTRTDVYSLGAILFQLCTGEAPPANATGDDLREQLRRVPQDLAAIALKSLSSRPENRYADAGALAADLRAFDNGARIAAREYSLAGILGHWLRHHKRLAVSVAVTTVIAAAIGVVALREVVLQRDRAARAKQEADVARATAVEDRLAAEQERDSAIHSEAALLIEKDPSRARDLLASRPRLPPAEALLLARALGAGVADRTISLMPHRIFRAWSDESLEMVAVVPADGKLRTIHLATGAVEVVASGLPQPAIVTIEKEGLVYVRRGTDGLEIVRSRSPMRAIPLGQYRPAYESPAARAVDGLYLLDQVGDLSMLTAADALVLVRRGVLGMAPFRDGLLACADGHLLQIHDGKEIAQNDGCRHDGGRYSLATNGADYVVQSTPNAVVAVRAGSRATLRIPEPNAFSLASSGLVVGVGRKDNTWYVRPNSNQVEDGPTSSAQPTALAADGDLATWGYTDGIARVRDTKSGATWTMVGHSAPIAWMFVSARQRRLVTVAGVEVRIWRIPEFAAQPLATNCEVMSIGPSPDGKRTGLACADGSVKLLERLPTGDNVAALHRHSGVAQGIAWRANEVCSSGWDGRVICTDTDTRQTRIVAEHSRPVRAIASAANVLAYALEDGTVWTQTKSGDRSGIRYQHSAEADSLTVNDAGSVASGAHDGSVMAYDRV